MNLTEICKLLRLSLTGSEHGLPVDKICNLLGRKKSLKRLDFFINKLKGKQNDRP